MSRNNVPVRNILRGRGVQTTILCPMCGVDVEHLLYVFLDCKFVKDCWKYMSLEFDTSEIESLPEWLLQRLGEENHEKMVRMTMVLWGIWNARNMRMWDNKVVTGELAMQWSV